MYNEDNIYICVQVMFCNSNFLLNYRKKQRVKNVVSMVCYTILWKMPKMWLGFFTRCFFL